MVTGDVPHDHGQLQLLLQICEEFFRRASPATHAELGALLLTRNTTGGPGWLIDMLGLTVPGSRLADDETDRAGRTVDKHAHTVGVGCRHLQQCSAGYAGVAL
ncbi:hypothetical protein [Dactylosporangium sp. NPDC006015]|uniref:hypothetical protein n=1 Tax=Dactylosporangium sp. NPDC006015 TaxID=3154576 RepID=UPI0033A7AE78